jgi:hypothetical protein
VKRRPKEDPWEVLGLKPGASASEVRRAYERLASALTPGALALYSLINEEEQHRLHERLRHAYVTLLRATSGSLPSKHQRQERTPEPAADAPDTIPVLLSSPEPPASAPESSAPMPVIDEATEFSGALLRLIREARGLTLREVVDRTRIRTQQLVWIEEEVYDRLPERVYLRGFVMAYAALLHLDPERVWSSYEKRRQAVMSAVTG